MPWFTVGLDTVFHVPRKVLIDHGTGSVSFQRGDHVRDLAPAWLGGFEHGNGSIALFDDDLYALPHLLQHGMHVTREFGLCHVDNHDVADHTSAYEMLVLKSSPVLSNASRVILMASVRPELRANELSNPSSFLWPEPTDLGQRGGPGSDHAFD
jgi:hypothetical protein